MQANVLLQTDVTTSDRESPLCAVAIITRKRKAEDEREREREREREGGKEEKRKGRMDGDNYEISSRGRNSPLQRGKKASFITGPLSSQRFFCRA